MENQFVMCKNDDEYPERQPRRLPGYDYSNNGAYYVTICIHDRTQRLFGDVINDKMKLSDVGYIVYNQWQQLPERFSHIQLDEFVVMPNHMHGIVIINRIERTLARGAPTKPINLQDKECYKVNTVGAGLALAREYFCTDNDFIAERAPARSAPTNTVIISFWQFSTRRPAQRDTANLSPEKIRTAR